MKKVFLPLLLILALGVLVQTALPVFAANFEDGYYGRTELQRKILDSVQKGEFGALEKQADELRKGKPRFADGGLKLNAFYQSFAKMKLFRRTDDEWLRLISNLEAWNRAYPFSVTARTSLAWAWYGYGWFARGEGFADSVTDEGWKLFRDRLNRAFELAGKPGSSTKDCPERHNLLLQLALSLSWDEDRFDQIFREAVEFDPDYHEFFMDKANRLLPRWGGAPGAWLRFAEESMKNAPAGKGKLLYAWIVSNIQYTGELQKFKESGVSWQTLKAGYRDLLSTYPGSSWTANRFAMFACLADDQETVRELLGNPDFVYNRDAWPGVEIDPCRVKAGLPSMREIATKQFAKQHRKMAEQIFKEMLIRSEKGDRKAMAMVGEMYSTGNGVPQDDVKAYAWLVLSGERRELLDEVASRLSPSRQVEGHEEVARIKALLAKEK
jgi:hypothetical protein